MIEPTTINNKVAYFGRASAPRQPLHYNAAAQRRNFQMLSREPARRAKDMSCRFTSSLWASFGRALSLSPAISLSVFATTTMLLLFLYGLPSDIDEKTIDFLLETSTFGILAHYHARLYRSRYFRHRASRHIDTALGFLDAARARSRAQATCPTPIAIYHFMRISRDFLLERDMRLLRRSAAACLFSAVA